MSEQASSDSDKAVAAAQDEASRTASDVVARADDEPRNEPPNSHPRRPRRITVVTLVVLATGLALAVAVTWIWRQQQAIERALARAEADSTVRIESVRTALSDLEDRLGAVDQRLLSGQQSLERLAERLDAIPGELAAVERRVDAVQGGSFDSRANWLRAEAEYYLALANTELQLAGRPENAAVALRLADDRLRTIADPALSPVRSQIADELLAVESLRAADVEGLAFSLGRLAERSEELPLREDAPENYDGRAEESEQDAEPGLGRLWQTTKNAFASIVNIERRDEPVAVALTAAEKALVRRQLAVELQLARIALLRAQQENFAISIGNARSLLTRDFDPSSADVEAALVLLDELGEVTLAQSLPDISGSLRALRALPAGDD